MTEQEAYEIVVIINELIASRIALQRVDSNSQAFRLVHGQIRKLSDRLETILRSAD